MLVQRNSKNNKLEVFSRNIGFLSAQHYLIVLYYFYVHIYYNNK